MKKEVLLPIGWQKINNTLYRHDDGRSIWYGPCSQKWFWNRGRSKSCYEHLTYKYKTPDSSCLEGSEKKTLEEALQASDTYRKTFTAGGIERKIAEGYGKENIKINIPYKRRHG